mgnify:CR=1 FL=1
MERQTVQRQLRPLAVAEPASMAAVLNSEAEWRDALVHDPALLEAILGAPVENVEPEPQVGPYFADLAVSTGGLDALVELQFGTSDARHLGQVTRYAMFGSADLVLWLCDEVSEGDAKVIEALNQVWSTKVLPVCVHTLRIPATGSFVQFGRIVEGRQYTLGRGLADGPATAREIACQRFWRALLARANAVGLDPFADHRPTRNRWIRTSVRAGSGLFLRIAIAAASARVGIQVDSGDAETNAALWEELVARRREIEEAVDAELDWAAPGRTGMIQTRVEGGYAERPEAGVENAVDLLGQLNEVVAWVIAEVPVRLLQPNTRNQTALY